MLRLSVHEGAKCLQVRSITQLKVRSSEGTGLVGVHEGRRNCGEGRQPGIRGLGRLGHACRPVLASLACRRRTRPGATPPKPRPWPRLPPRPATRLRDRHASACGGGAQQDRPAEHGIRDGPRREARTDLAHKHAGDNHGAHRTTRTADARPNWLCLASAIAAEREWPRLPVRPEQRIEGAPSLPRGGL